MPYMFYNWLLTGVTGLVHNYAFCLLGMHISLLLNAGCNKPKWAILKRYWLISWLIQGTCIVLASILSPTQYAGYWSIQCAYTCIASQPV